ncbi:AAA family ATPase [Acinetobacter equi]|uniref:ATP-dependent dsDNA exonuclease n=1 Tax=Acinetobacter equi TaxID=1324350 RepID=A0A0N9W175_9GAMM|nr:AAA family ATPase [Acinetobacter equi]ALH95314.1 ATP-dependent dsDNA exonuclease [Acinetobacter equi]
MKILSIRIKNLASLAGEHFIDFESEPLASAGLIAIVGKTGAGKSTILDAMCLALFNRIPRLKDSDGRLIDVDGSELLSNSPLTVLRRGTGHGFAELSFVAQDQKVYLARWEIKRARENPNGKLQSAQRSLKCLTDGNVIADKAKAVESAIQKLTQLSFEQFTRAVLLAQSEVTAFLKARDNERGELLEYLTNSNIFGKIGQLAFEKTKQIANQRKELESVLGHIEILSDEDFATFDAQFKILNNQYQQLEAEKQILQKQQQWFEQKQKLVVNIQTRQQQLQTQQQLVDALAPQKIQLQRLEHFSSIRPSVIQQQSLNAEITQLQPKLEHAQKQFTVIEQQFNTEKIAFEQIETEQKQQDLFESQHHEKIKLVRERITERLILVEQLRKAKHDIQDLENQLTPHLNNEILIKEQLKKIHDNIAQYTAQLELSNHFSNLDDALSAHIEQVQRFIESYSHFEKNYGDLKHANSQLLTQQNQLNELIQKFGEDDVLNQKITTFRTERDQFVQKLNQLNVIQHQWQNFQNIDTEYHRLTNLQNTLSQQITHNQAELKNAENNYQDQKTAHEQLQKILQQQRLLNTENIEKLRANLVDGEACLVCGSTHHPYAKKDDFSNELVKLQEQQEQQALVSEKVAFDIWQKLQTTLTQQTTSLDANTVQLATLTAQQQQLQIELAQKLSLLDITFDFSQNHDVFTQLIQSQKDDIQQAQQQLELSLDTHEKVQKQRHELVQIIQQTSQHLSKVQQAELNIQHIIHLLSDTEQQMWKQKTLSTAEHILNCLQQRQDILKQLNELKTQLSQITQQFDQCTQQIQFGRENIQSAKNRIENLTTEGKKNSDIAIQAIFEMTQITVEKPHEWLADFEKNSLQLKDRINLARKSFDQIRQSFDTAQSALKECNTQNTQLQKQVEQASIHIQQWLSQHLDFDAALLQQLSTISHEQEQQLKQRISEVERTYTDLQASIKTVQDQLEQHLEQQPEIELDTLISKLTELAQHLNQLAEQRDDIRLKLEVHHRNVIKQKEFAEQIQLIQTEEHRWNKISSLMGDSTGKKFRDYAQQYNLDILIEYANQQLAMLSQRYTLKRLDNSLSLAIIDHDMDGETRSVASLSGGESFLTALALSLAIANMASGSMKIESLFIDEGFGTLDASSLHMVMNALDQLQSQGRKVVLISHIQEMHERIPVQIQVKPIGAGASTIEISG